MRWSGIHKPGVLQFCLCCAFCLLYTTGVNATGIALLATASVINWQMGLVMLACVPFIGASMVILSKLMSSSTQEGTDYDEKAGGVATEVLIAPWKQRTALAVVFNCKDNALKVRINQSTSQSMFQIWIEIISGGFQRLGRAGIRRFRPRVGHQNSPLQG